MNTSEHKPSIASSMSAPQRTKMWEENPGETSSIRVGMLLITVSCCYMAIVGVHLGRDLIDLSALVLPMLGVAYGAKVAQKGKE